MKIIDIVDQRQTISFEFFPPKTKDGIPGVLRTIDNLKGYHPDFVSVTYGAGGTTQAFTEEITVQIKEQADLEVMAHLTCSGQTQDEVHQVLERLDEAGIENIIALRGDPPKGQTDFAAVDGGFSHASDLLRHIGENFKFGLAAACYPEAHTESVDLETDMAHTKFKVEQGAQFLVTQLFYNNEDYFRFVDRARNAGINVPLIPGVLPILSNSQIRRFTSLCGATIPKDLDAKLERFADDDDAVRELGVEYATKQVEELWASGVPGIHFYVLNRTYSVSNILNNLNLPGHMATP